MLATRCRFLAIRVGHPLMCAAVSELLGNLKPELRISGLVVETVRKELPGLLNKHHACRCDVLLYVVNFTELYPV